MAVTRAAKPADAATIAALLAAAFDGYRALGAFRVDADRVPRAADVTRLDEALHVHNLRSMCAETALAL